MHRKNLHLSNDLHFAKCFSGIIWRIAIQPTNKNPNIRTAFFAKCCSLHYPDGCDMTSFRKDDESTNFKDRHLSSSFSFICQFKNANRQRIVLGKLIACNERASCIQSIT